MKQYDPTSFFEFLGYGPGDQTYDCPGLRSLSIYCRGDEAQLRALLDPLPFELADDRFLVSIADFTNNSGMVYYDAAVVLAVEYDGHHGGTYYFEWEDSHISVTAGRELWGYPKHFAVISLTDDESGARGRVALEGTTAFEAELVFDDTADPSAWRGVSFSPHLQVRAVPQVNGASFQSFDIISRNTSLDFEPILRRFGRAQVRLGNEITVDGEPLRIVETLGGEYTVGNFHATRENGTPKIIASLI
ncbi:acetoacetate decarboxylase family protein [Microbacterium sp.]|uniref:acetoacetate decarboxylase family protein n=1 Tax=Microbacterium sp. TaxID=51671 RepID=UPI0039E62E51